VLSSLDLPLQGYAIDEFCAAAPYGSREVSMGLQNSMAQVKEIATLSKDSLKDPADFHNEDDHDNTRPVVFKPAEHPPETSPQVRDQARVIQLSQLGVKMLNTLWLCIWLICELIGQYTTMFSRIPWTPTTQSF
jgi:hypothetical protein